MGDVLFKRTGRLFARPSFIEGASRVLDLGSTLNEYNSNLTTEEADSAAIQSDWYAVGDDILNAMTQYQYHG
ncbi:MAG: hypothetical protein M0Q46_00820 [Endomicrobiales bacterium]|nr:hypothetical protein [Endomicrobiales bacterium]